MTKKHNLTLTEVRSIDKPLVTRKSGTPDKPSKVSTLTIPHRVMKTWERQTKEGVKVIRIGTEKASDLALLVIPKQSPLLLGYGSLDSVIKSLDEQLESVFYNAEDTLQEMEDIFKK